MRVLDSNKLCLSGQAQQQCTLPAAGLTLVTVCRIAGPVCSGLASKVLKQRPGTIQRAKDVCLEFCELEQGEAVVVACLGAACCWQCSFFDAMPVQGSLLRLSPRKLCLLGTRTSPAEPLARQACRSTEAMQYAPAALTPTSHQCCDCCYRRTS